MVAWMVAWTEKKWVELKVEKMGESWVVQLAD
jgi:hypothetical protein